MKELETSLQLETELPSTGDRDRRLQREEAEGEREEAEEEGGGGIEEGAFRSNAKLDQSVTTTTSTPPRSSPFGRVARLKFVRSFAGSFVSSLRNCLN